MKRFVDNTLRLCIFTDHQLFDRFHKYNLKSDKARSGKVALSLKELNQFTPGDYVVHTDHGIGRFSGLVRIPNGDTTQEVLKLVFQNEDVVFVSIHSLHKVSKYKGKEGEAPRLNKLGTGAWEKLKERTKSKIKDIARDLIKLYSQRRQEKGFSYSPDSFCSVSWKHPLFMKIHRIRVRRRLMSRRIWKVTVRWIVWSAEM